LRPSNAVVYCAIDRLISVQAKDLAGFSTFLESLAEAGIPCVWSTGRTRIQLDATIRKFGHGHPFLGEGGCGAYIPEDYFHLKPSSRTMRLGRFTCIPVATLLPAAAGELEDIAEETGIEVVPLSALSPRELSQNTGLPQKEAELLRQRDFDELFFFAGASDADIQTFTEAAAKKKSAVRRCEIFWSISIGADVRKCVRELSALFERSMRNRPFNVAIGTSDNARELFAACDRAILLKEQPDAEHAESGSEKRQALELELFSPDVWERALEAIQTRKF
jgi:predicted mannosyl-3-phosphoglycerate phosphatase (HAD superfamily)